MSRRRGVFITLEGIEGAGKSTSAEFIRNHLRAAGLPVDLTREPGGTPLAEAIRELVLDDWAEGIPLMTELLLVFAARAAHIENRIRPGLARGEWVVSDRFTDATYAYQGAGRDLGTDVVATLEGMVQGSLRPDHVLVFDLPVEQGLARAARRGEGNRFERERHEFMQAVRQCYLERARAEPTRYHIIDASLEQPAVEGQLQTLLDDIVIHHRAN